MINSPDVIIAAFLQFGFNEHTFFWMPLQNLFKWKFKIKKKAVHKKKIVSFFFHSP